MCAVNFRQKPNQQRRTFDFGELEKAARELIKKVSFGVSLPVSCGKAGEKENVQADKSEWFIIFFLS